MIQMNQDVLKMHTEANEQRLAIIEAQLANEKMDDGDRLGLLDEKRLLLEELDKMREEIEKDNAEIEEIGKDG